MTGSGGPGGPETPATELVFADHDALRDLGTYAARARSLDPDGAIRLQVSGTTLAAYVGVLPGQGLTSSGTLLGLRAIGLAQPATLDVTVPLGAIGDRVARPQDRPVLAVPPATVTVRWAAVSPPRQGWERVGQVDGKVVLEVAQAGIAEITEGAPEGSGANAVATLRHLVWSALSTTEPPLPRGLAFAAYGLGFVGSGEPLQLYANGSWTRLSSSVGHVLMR